MPFSKGDIVRRAHRGEVAAGALESGLKGRVCKVVTRGLTYRVAYQGFDRCILQFENSLVAAAGPGPGCPNHASCI